MQKDIFTTFQAADYCKVHYATIKNWIRKGLLQAFKTPGGHFRLKKDELDRFLNEHEMNVHEKIASFSESPSPETAGKKKILIIDDEYPIREGISKALAKKDDYSVRTAGDGYEAGKIIPEFQPDVVVLDLMMPWMDGFGVCERLRQILPAETKIICLTGFPGNGNKIRILQLGADICLTKPVESAELIGEIEKLAG